MRVVLLLVVTVAGGCANESICHLEHEDCAPYIRQVLVTDDEPQDPMSKLSLAYGVHPLLNTCDISGACPHGLFCLISPGALDGHCVDETGQQPAPRSVPTSGFEIRVVMGDLLNSSTVEQVACACLESGTCSPGREFTRVATFPPDCSSCEGGHCSDPSDPQSWYLLPGIATITCGGFAYTTNPFDGRYQPSGNQYPTSTAGFGALGPAIVLRPATALPSNSDCTLTLIEAIATKRGRSLQRPTSPILFHTGQ